MSFVVMEPVASPAAAARDLFVNALVAGAGSYAATETADAAAAT